MSDGTLLGGRVRHAQPQSGHRTGLEPVLLAASIPAAAGDRVLEGGTGSAAAMLCLAARVAGLTGIAVERDAAMATVARTNLAANAVTDITVLHADLLTAAFAGMFDHAFANPPWHDAAGTASPDHGREASRRAAPGLIAAWARRLAAPLRHRGTLTLIVAAGALPECLAAFGPAGCGGPAVLPLWPKPGIAAKLLLVRAVKGGRAPFRLLPGLVLHLADGAFTVPAQDILRGGRGLGFEQGHGAALDPPGGEA